MSTLGAQVWWLLLPSSPLLPGHHQGGAREGGRGGRPVPLMGHHLTDAFEDFHRNNDIDHFLSQDYDLAPDLVHDFHHRHSKLDSKLIITFNFQVTVLDLSLGQSRRERVSLERHTACACHCTVKVASRSRSNERCLYSISISGTPLQQSPGLQAT